MKFCVLTSGSKGNCTYLEINNHKFLIDIGINFLSLSSKLEEINVKCEEIEAIFITHLHQDHIMGLKRFVKKYSPMIYVTKKMYENLDVELDNYELYDTNIEIQNIYIDTIQLSHDTPECRGYIFNYDNRSLVYITDTGYINIKNHDKLKDKTIYIMESNHDVNLLMKGRYPYHIKMRILGDRGHLSNKDSANYLSKFIGNNTKCVILAHLSHENNDPDIALNNLKQVLMENNEQHPNILIATQENRTELIEV